ncbi:alpha/beta hydrolase [Methylomonas sp. SURF-2]|uniref:Alpha/beta hydrolase n=1 Tax=Methylomonas subterranea TaxID=2952225 RepID=A0ABT1TDN8_9GAMM|nr:alpha/beta hydrolase [Methylomonas sp. SURF-2]MCQ8103570.1 alpha/beta hydrolase [Methylomonas sp. SURF-2]
MPFFRHLACAGLSLAVTACASPAAKLHQRAEQLGLQTLELPGGSYRLTAFYRPGQANERILHVYLEGDGRPWLRGQWPAADPTTHASLMLPLLALDTKPALYLGRPCYNGHATDPGCEASLWTSARYGATVVSAMADALASFCESHAFKRIVLLGHSGGGSLAMLLAARLPQTALIVTLAGNYDIDAWADYHHYSRLDDSLNPAGQAETGLPEWHFLAERDRTVPPELFFSALRRRARAHVEVVPGLEHHEGWLEQWPQILNRIAEMR